MSKHTPGPWAVNPWVAQVDAFDNEDKSPNPVCQLLWPTETRSEDETLANAKLIAAAPEMLEALQAVFEMSNDSNANPHELLAKISQIAEQALKKVEEEK